MRLAIITPINRLLYLKLPRGSAYEQVEALLQGLRQTCACLRAVQAEDKLLTGVGTVGILLAKLPKTAQTVWSCLKAENPSGDERELLTPGIDRGGEVATKQRLMILSRHKGLTIITSINRLLSLKLPIGSAYEQVEALVQGLRQTCACLRAVQAEDKLLTGVGTVGILLAKLPKTAQTVWFCLEAENASSDERELLQPGIDRGGEVATKQRLMVLSRHKRGTLFAQAPCTRGVRVLKPDQGTLSSPARPEWAPASAGRSTAAYRQVLTTS